MIDANKILQADVLDLIFDGRNKEYGAYELRTNYRKRLLLAVSSMVLLCVLFVLLSAFANKPRTLARDYVIPPDLQLDDIKEKEKVVEPPPVEPPKPKEQIKVEQFVSNIKITNEDVKPDEMPPPVEDLYDVKIGTVDEDGNKDNGIVAPPVDEKGTGVTEQPKKQDEDADKIHLTVQIESEYPGGLSAWIRYLTKHLPRYYTEDFVERGLQGRVLVQFVVDREGNVSDVQGIEGPKELWEIAETVIRKSGKWTAAIQNGHKVKSYKRQPVIFKIEDQE